MKKESQLGWILFKIGMFPVLMIGSLLGGFLSVGIVYVVPNGVYGLIQWIITGNVEILSSWNMIWTRLVWVASGIWFLVLFILCYGE